MNKAFVSWVEDYLFYPNFFQKLLSILLLPLSFVYLLIITVKKIIATKINFNIPIISIGNLIVGGSGKTPLVIKLAKNKKDVAVILRGYGRASKGLFVISNNGNILEDVKTSGDEAMLLAKSLSKATVIVSEDRKKAILKAKELGAKLIFLDDGFSKYDIIKFDILLKPKYEPTNNFCLPSGGYRELKLMYSKADLVLKEGIDFKRIVTYKKGNQTVSTLPLKLVLLTAISKPKRLLEFLPKNIILEAYEDHHIFTKDEINNLVLKYVGYSFISTQKDFVKLLEFNLTNLYLMSLELEIEKNIDIIDEYIRNNSKLEKIVNIKNISTNLQK